MTSIKGKLVRLLSGVILTPATVTSTQDVGGFRRLVLRGAFPRVHAGTKIQVLLPSDDVRTYSPIPGPNGMELLGWKHAGGPGARWMSEVKEGDLLRFVGPQRSLELAEGPVIIVGDETSVAVASAFEAERPGQVRAVFQVGDTDAVQAAALAMGLRQAVVLGRNARDAVVEAVCAAQRELPDATLALSGGSELVVALRSALRARGIRHVKTKAYWIPGRVGLD